MADLGSTSAPTYPDLAGKVAVVTGGSRGIGAATARLLASNGAHVAVVGRDEAAIADVVGDIRGEGGVALGVPADCSDPDDLARLRDRVTDDLGDVAIVAAFAGGKGAPRPVIELSVDEWRTVLDSELTSTFLTVQTFLPDLLFNGRGAIVTMSSSAGRQPAGREAARANLAYACAKAGVVMLTRYLAPELASSGVRINCLAPATVQNGRIPTEHVARLAAQIPLGRIGEPIDVAVAAAFLASDASAFLTGVTLDLAGGQVVP